MAKKKKVFYPENHLKTSIKFWCVRPFALEFINIMLLHSNFQDEITDKKHFFG